MSVSIYLFKSQKEPYEMTSKKETIAEIEKELSEFKRLYDQADDNLSRARIGMQMERLEKKLEQQYAKNKQPAKK